MLMYTSVREKSREYTGRMDREHAERTTREVREHLADVVNAAIQGQVTYITSRGRRVAAVVPLAVADRAEGPEPQPGT
jgi:prevent-host-death family protein